MSKKNINSKDGLGKNNDNNNNKRKSDVAILMKH